jgi:hypothetical protein
MFHLRHGAIEDGSRVFASVQSAGWPFSVVSGINLEMEPYKMDPWIKLRLASCTQLDNQIKVMHGT